MAKGHLSFADKCWPFTEKGEQCPWPLRILFYDDLSYLSRGYAALPTQMNEKQQKEPVRGQILRRLARKKNHYAIMDDNVSGLPSEPS